MGVVGGWVVGKQQTASTLSRQLRFNVHPADGALLIGEEPLVHTQLMEEVHTRQAPGQQTQGSTMRHSQFHFHLNFPNTVRTFFVFVFFSFFFFSSLTNKLSGEWQPCLGHTEWPGGQWLPAQEALWAFCPV